MKALYTENDKMRQESRNIWEGGKHLAAMILRWRTVVAMWKADKKLAKSRRADRRRRSEEWAGEMEEARKRGQWHEVWGLVRKIAGTGLGPKAGRMETSREQERQQRKWLSIWKGKDRMEDARWSRSGWWRRVSWREALWRWLGGIWTRGGREREMGGARWGTRGQRLGRT